MLTEVRFSIILNVPESGFAMLYDSLQEQQQVVLLEKLLIDVLGQHVRIVLAGNARHCNLDSSSNPSCHASSVA